MDKRVTSLKTPSELYKSRRPEQFSDSDITHECLLTREQLAFELDQITTNQKHDEFETLCRRLAEKFISPNLVPQVGPTGGGDGKTDSETYPVSTDISDRWFVPEKGWEKDEKWAFAISAKKTWKSKAKSDIKKIVETEREYSSAYFMTNQKPSSKKRKDAQDEFTKEFKIEVTILDGEWILEKLLNNDLISLAVDTLNLSQIHKKKISIIGENDARRSKKLLQLEENIDNPNRYSSHDYQLVEDAIESVILSRMLELPRDDIEGKFSRAERFCKKVDNPRQWLKIHYQKAWTYYNWYDDYSSFANEYIKFKNHLSDDSSINDIELFTNLVNLLRGLSALSPSVINDLKLDIEAEKKYLKKILEKFINDDTKPSSALIAKTYLSFQTLLNFSLEKQDNSKNSRIFSDISEILQSSIKHIEYPFSSIEDIILELGNFFPNDADFDSLIDTLAQTSEKRDSELSAGNTFLKRGSQKFLAGYYKESVIYFGKAVIKLAKEETQHGYYLALIGLAKAYSNLGLMWASNNCLIAASNVPFKSWFQTGIIDKRIEYCAYELAMNELLIGRVPSFLIWHELFSVVSNNTATSEDAIPNIWLMDACFAVRLLHDSEQEELISSLPDILEKEELFISQDICLYKLGHIESIIQNYEGIDIKEEHELDIHFSQIASQPFRKQMMYELNFVSDETICLNSNILGCEFKFKFKKNKELLLIAETLLAFFESYLSTSLEKVLSKTETIIISIIENPDVEYVNYKKSKESSSEYNIEVSRFNVNTKNIDALWKSVLTLFTNILFENFHINDPLEYLKNLFEKEELNERLSIVFQHRNTTFNILGDNPKLFFDQWNNILDLKSYIQKRPKSVIYSNEKDSEDNLSEIDPAKVRHDERKTLSIIEESLWDQAKWCGFGFFVDNEGLGIFIGYEHENYGTKIFNNWIKKLGVEDLNEEISITIIKGVDRNNPFWYRVLITSNIKTQMKEANKYKLVTILSRFHEMNATNPENLKNLISGYKHFKKYRFCPAQSNLSGTNTQITIEKAITKTELKIINAWEIGKNDFESSAIKLTDTPIIPKKIDKPPILQILKPK